MKRGGLLHKAFATAFVLAAVLTIVVWSIGGSTVGGLLRDLTLLAFVPVGITAMRDDGKWRPRQVVSAGVIWLLALTHLAITAWPRTVSSAPQILHNGAAPVLWSEHTVGTGQGRHAWFARIKETDLMRLGATVGLTTHEYETFERSHLINRVPVRAEAGTRLFDDWLGRPLRYQLLRPVGHGPFPVIVFLHGHGGLFDSYARVLERLVAERQVAVLLPTFGFGHWESPEAADHLRRIVEDARGMAPLTDQPWTLAGLSAGGRGAFVQAVAAGDRLGFEIGRLVLISAPPPPAEVGTPEVPTVWIAGEGDERIPIRSVRDFLEPRLRATPRFTLEVLEATHLLLLEQTDRVFGLLAPGAQGR